MIIKICGLTNTCEVEHLKENKVDLAGMVLFFEKSKRNISVEQAKEIIEAIRLVRYEDGGNLKAVAVTVSPTKDQITEIENAGFDFLQIHGSISDELINNCKIPILRAFNVDDLDKYEHYLSLSNIKGFVFDAGEPGSGKTFDWDMLKEFKRDENRLYILAGGLDSTNVSRAIGEVKPDGVDVSTGVEYKDKLGKDPIKIVDFVKAVRK